MKVITYRFDDDYDIDVVYKIFYKVDRVFYDRSAKQLVILQQGPIKKQILSLESDFITGILVQPDDLPNDDYPF